MIHEVETIYPVRLTTRINVEDDDGYSYRFIADYDEYEVSWVELDETDNDNLSDKLEKDLYEYVTEVAMGLPVPPIEPINIDQITLISSINHN